MDIEDQKSMLEFQSICSEGAILRLHYELLKLERLKMIESPEFDPWRYAEVKALLAALGQSEE